MSDQNKQNTTAMTQNANLITDLETPYFQYSI